MGDKHTTFLIVTVLILATVVLVAAMKYRSAAKIGRTSHANDEELRELSRQAIAASRESAAALSALKSSVADIQGRLSNVEGILKEVQ